MPSFVRTISKTACIAFGRSQRMAEVERKKLAREPAARNVDMSALSRMSGFNVRMLDLRIMKSFSEQIAETGLTPAAATVVLVVESNPGIALGKLADALLVKRPNMTKLVKRLEARSFVRRRGAVNDKRSISLVLTPGGHRLAKKLRALQAQADSFAMAALKPTERAQFIDFVQRIRRSLERKAG
jgi:DNA-binding MarR family transcriptional regulator